MTLVAQMFEHKKDKTESVKSETEKRFNVVSKRDSLLLPNEGSPAGWINRVNDRAEAAQSGSEWRSDAFTIVGPGSQPKGVAGRPATSTAKAQ